MTNWYEEQILKALILENNSMIYDYWKEPPIKPLISVYVFNYTNVEEAMKGKEKPKVEEVGPYTFRETIERVNIHFHPNGTVSFQEKRSHEFVKELSTDLRQVVITPNLPLITAVAFSKSSYVVTSLGLTFLMKSFDIRPFHKLTAYEFIWGAKDSFTSVASKVAEILDRQVPTGFGVLSSRKGVSPDVLTIHNGATGFDKFGVISRFNGQEKLNAWKSECDRLDGGDGTLYPPRLLGSSDPVYVYAKEFCRRMPLMFDKHTETIDGFPALRYKNPKNIFSRPQINPNNSCFCVSECAPDGLQSTEPCSYGAPFYISLPHFLRADPKLHSSVLGLSPDEEKHTTYIDIHQKLGIPIGGVSRLQMNIRIVKPPHFSPLDELEDGTFLPIGWLECVSID
ncbi:scavenger receptor class B member 1-like [Lycorma delicatula]|uniref:scavenger receptor class B member 1-like n=1 Tax=Lycorma delicatula TaxID=130591 RepID=UPI003F5197D5